MRYTAQGPKSDKCVREYLDIVVGVLRKELPEIKSIILAGGFGRGEGSLERRGDKLVPVNDFEIYLVVESKVSEKRLNEAANKASGKLGLKKTGVPFHSFSKEDYADTFYIDLKAFKTEDLGKILPMIRYYELRNAGAVIWGKDYLARIPEFKIKDLPLAEGLRVLLNRIAMLSHYFSTDFLRRTISRSEKHGLLYLGGKALVDIPTALLLLNDKFKPSYRERARVFHKCYKDDFKELHSKIPDLPNLAQKALDFKLNPDFSIKISPFEIFQEYRIPVGESTKYYVSRLVRKKIDDYPRLAEIIYHDLWELYYGPYVGFRFRLKGFWLTAAVYAAMSFLNILYFYRMWILRKVFYPKCLLNPRGPDLTIFTSLIYLIYSIQDDKSIDPKMLGKARYYLEKTYPVKEASHNPEEEWNIISRVLSNAYVLYFFLKIV
ncbi:hypothetical protein A2716_02485 [candidate division WWE3 bacterium RIFCSPHIGHO2_01_FULL_40_23]|uniref:Uncharacterized protein n=1 Tax=candidate division WWE3 bacterium RIFCSPLOWO2_01_FULL_41_18 TaxID=1802625 RepID=A0A1F4VGJ7_UNCKA|nr:MAG: hypothetical protein A2716_02485 [candidate division WWE3 bacterium RIFCSPHIGHO2_01_FULL_40_23]OGC55853.1 MAG: hypothetical protein A3A78_02335 [candidate division WWE3 bacterium RIFCSPLOWO2_01_FULL_41_18]